MDKALVFGTKDCRFVLHLCAEVLGCTAGWFSVSLPEWLRSWT